MVTILKAFEQKGTDRSILVPQVHILPPSYQHSPMAAPSVPNPYDERIPNIATLIDDLLKLPLKKLMDPDLRFKISFEAAAENFKLLQESAYDLGVLCQRNRVDNRRSAMTFCGFILL